MSKLLITALAGALFIPSQYGADLWNLAVQFRDLHRFSTIFTAQDVRDRLSTDEGIDAAINWCRTTGITKVYIEEFRDGYQAEKSALLHAKKRFIDAGFEVSGCVTTTRVGKPTGGYKPLSCYTDKPTQQKVKAVFEYAASLFDEIMIDDFWFTDCTCQECDRARTAKTVHIGDKTYPVSGDTWEDYRRELMLRLSEDYVLGAAKRVNPNVRLIIKYPQWYDRFHERGYDVARETRIFDRIWVGTETRDRDKGGEPQYEGYFIMRWLGALGGEKTGGGWFDPYSTTERTYVEQARQTVLGGARESLLFCYGGLLRQTGPANIAALRQEIPELLETSREVRRRAIRGIAAYKPPNSHPGKEPFVFDYIGMLGLPLAPCYKFPFEAPAAFFSIHALKDPRFAARLAWFIESGRPVLLTDGLAAQLTGKVKLDAPNVHVLPVGGAPKSLLSLSAEELNKIRSPLLRALGASFRGPSQIGLYLFEDGSWVVENFNDQDVEIELNGQTLSVPARGWLRHWE